MSVGTRESVIGAYQGSCHKSALWIKMPAYLFREFMGWLEERDRWYVGLIWLAV